MEGKLKKQRNTLFRRIILIMLAIWLTASAVFCIIKLNSEKLNIQNHEVENLSHFKSLLSIGNSSKADMEFSFLEYNDFVYYAQQLNNDKNSQMIITNRRTDKVISDTKDCIGLQFSVKVGSDATGYAVAFVDYQTIKTGLTDEEFDEISEKLNAVRNDGNYYELICTKLHVFDTVFVPLELKLVLVNGNDPRFLVDEESLVYDLSENLIDGIEVYQTSAIQRNVIPKEFFLHGSDHKDIIGSLTKDQQKSTVDMFPIGFFTYIFYTNDYMNFYDPNNSTNDAAWIIQYAKEVNTLDSCKKDLALGIAGIFFFFLTIAVILCVMIWHTVKAQIIQEQKRIDLTNALAHDITTPLFVISGYAYSLKEKIDESERDAYIDNIIEQTDEVNGLVHKMIDLSKLDSYEMKLNKTEFDLCELTSSLLHSYTVLPDKKKITFAHSGSSNVNGDRELITTVLKNLIDNAVKYSLPETEIKIGVNDNTFTISNRCEAMTKAEIKQLWQPYVRKDKSRHKRGNGLGLSIVKSILELHDVKYGASVNDDVFTVTISF